MKLKLEKNFQDVINELNSFISILENRNLEMFFVGGCVRDLFLNKPSKDIDIIIPNISLDDLQLILNSCGKVDLVGKSFGILKFKPNGFENIYDIAVPRTEISSGNGHTDFEINCKDISLKDDLKRRDFSINAICMKIDGTIYDPFNGIIDLKKKIIKILNANSFKDDPLRLLRLVQFSCRFDLKPNVNTFMAFNRDLHLVKSVSNERIIEELRKAITGNKETLLKCLMGSEGRLFKFLFNHDPLILEFYRLYYSYPCNVNVCENLPEFCHVIQADFLQLSATNHEKTYFQALEMLKKSNNYIDTFKAIQVNKFVLYSENLFKDELQHFSSGYLPTNIKELQISGKDIINLGVKPGELVGIILNTVLEKVLKFEIENKREYLINYLKKII